MKTKDCKYNGMHYILSLLFACFVSLSLTAQDARATEILEESREVFIALTDFSADLKYTLKNPNLTNPIVKSGKVVQSGNKFTLVFEDQHSYCDGNSFWIFLVNDHEVTIMDYDPDQGNLVDEVYNISGPNTVARRDGMEGNLQKISIFINDDDSDLYQVNYWINENTKLIEKALLNSKNGTTMIYEFSNSVTNSGIPESSFAPRMANYDGFVINDVRN